MQYNELFTKEKLAEIFPPERADAFFDALYGDAEDGAYDIEMDFVEANDEELVLKFELKQRPGKCLACNLTYGLPEVFKRHPIINLKGVVASVAQEMGKEPEAVSFELGATKELSRQLHYIPLYISLT